MLSNHCGLAFLTIGILRKIDPDDCDPGRRPPVGYPAVDGPLLAERNGMPFGIQIMTKKTDELTLLEVSDHLMKKHRNNKPVTT